MMTDEIFDSQAAALSGQIRTLLSDKPVLVNGETCTFATINNIVVSSVNRKPDVKVLLSNGKQLALFTGLHTGTLTFDAETSDSLLAYEAEAIEFTSELHRRDLINYIEGLNIARRKAERDKAERQAKARAEALKQRALRDAGMLDAALPLTGDNDFYVALGYLAAHTKKISARLPDYLGNWFVKNFGETEKYLVDSSKRTSGGYSMQWSLTFRLTLDTNNNIPVYLQQYLTQQEKKTKHIAATAFVFSLVRDYGFKFGTKQDIDEILKHIPESQLTAFNLGYTLGADS